MGENETNPGTGPAHQPGTRKGEEMTDKAGKEPGHHDTGDSHANRPSGTSTARSSTGVNPEAEEPIDPKMPNMPPA